MTSAFIEQFIKHSEKDLIICPDGRRFTYSQLWGNARKLSENWGKDGLKQGQAVAIMISNCLEFICCYLACYIGGFIAVPVNVELGEHEITHILNVSQVHLIVDEPPAIDDRTTSDNDYNSKTNENSMFAIFFTSGSTGLPKGVRHRFSSLVGNVISFNSLTALDEEIRLYHILPMAYMAGFLNSILVPIMAGGTVVLGPRFSPRTALNFWAKPLNEAVNTLWISPSIAAALCRTSRDITLAQKACSNIKNIFCGMAPLPSSLRETFLTKFGVHLQESYGTSESLLISAQTLEQARTELNSGSLLAEIKYENRPNEDGQLEFHIHSPFSMDSYLTENGILALQSLNGFIPTGDIADVIDGCLTIKGRIKDLIIRGGVNVSPIAIENIFTGLNGVRDVAVVGLPDDFWGELIVLCIEGTDGFDTEDLIKEIRRIAKERLGHSQRPDRIEFMKSFPRTANGKIRKNILRKELF